MSADPPLETVEQTVTCQICHHVYDEDQRVPRELGSGEIICHICCQDPVIWNKDSGTLKCPFTTAIFPCQDVSQLPKAFPVLRLVRARPKMGFPAIGSKAADSKDAARCANCHEVSATVHCGKCGDGTDYCDACFLEVHKLPALSKHEGVCLSTKPKPETRCSEHDERLVIWCEHCKVPICSLCKESGSVHYGHSTRTLHAVLRTTREILQRRIEDLATFLAELKRREEKAPSPERARCIAEFQAASTEAGNIFSLPDVKFPGKASAMIERLQALIEKGKTAIVVLPSRAAPCLLPGTVGPLCIQSQDATSVRVVWQAPSQSATGYEVQHARLGRAEDNADSNGGAGAEGPSWFRQQPDATKTWVTLSDLTPASHYAVRVRAVNTAGYGPFVEAQFHTESPCRACVRGAGDRAGIPPETKAAETKAEELIHEFRDVLDQLTPEKYDALLKQAASLPVSSAEVLKSIVQAVFEKAVQEAGMSPLYARFCDDLKGTYPVFKEDGEVLSFTRCIITSCQLEFSRMFERNSVESILAGKQRKLGAIRFIGELFVRRLLSASIIYYCIEILLGDPANPNEGKLEALCHLTETVGKRLDEVKANPKAGESRTGKEVLADMMKTLEDVANAESHLTPSLRINIKNLVGLYKPPARWSDLLKA